MEYAVAFDATALAVPADFVGGHTLRGIGRYIGGLLDALSTEQRSWAEEHLRPVVTRGSPSPAAGRPLRTRRPALRSRDIGWLTGWLADRIALERNGSDVSLWHVLDPHAPLSPLPESRTVRTAYDLIPYHEPAALARIRRHRRATYRLYTRGLQRCRLVLAISEITATDIHATLGVPADRIRVIYPAVPVPAPTPSPTAVAHQPGRRADLLFVGVPDPTKQPELAIAALVECRRRGHDVRLRFCGYQRSSDTAHLTALADAGGVRDSVELLGRVDDARLTALYRESVLLAVSRTEGFGLPAVEALMAGGRVVAGSAPVYRETLGQAADFAHSADGNGMADAYEAAISRVETDPPADLVERYSPRAVAASLVAAYEEALA